MRLRGKHVSKLIAAALLLACTAECKPLDRRWLAALGSRGGATATEERQSPAAATEDTPSTSIFTDPLEDVYDPFQGLTPLDSTKLSIEHTTEPKPKPAKEGLIWGATFSDHMLEVDWDDETGWHPPEIVPFHDLELSPAASVLHYGLEAFEGLKAYAAPDGAVLLFRPDLNLARFNASLKRLRMPTFDAAELQALIAELLSVDADWVPRGEGYALYLRPTAISTTPSIGVAPARRVKLYVIASPCGPYYKEGFVPVKLYADTTYTRSWPGGAGYTKTGGNYAPTIFPAAEAQKRGCSQVLWLYGEDDLVTEVGAMNFFALLRDARDPSRLELVTPTLDRRDILAGVTRASVLDLARSWGDCAVSERDVGMRELRDAAREGRLVEAFATGTAAVISPIHAIEYRGEDLVCARGGDGIGPFAQRLWDALRDIQYGRVRHAWSVRAVEGSGSNAEAAQQ
ncbi:branched chain amino acid aminotransferase [Tribonema minus]|uniref:Branched chain amino acid aminotransferase n=1 Tax=Tribonema minus TaxID=303371 RepID=A0A835Z010_9STRA|nr:branched chain amino acid aminotransferase [Tribonema minus]